MRLILLALTVLFAALPAAAQYEASLVADINPGSAPSSPKHITVYDGRLFFQADDGQHGPELWMYDPSTGEAGIVADVNPGMAGSNPWELAVYDGRLFFTADDGEHGFELWAYDATTDEAGLVADLRMGSGFNSDSMPRFLTVYDDRLFFSAEVDYRGLWVYDADTNEASIVVGVNSAHNPGELIVYAEKLFFSASTPTTGQELWYYDALSDEVTLAADIDPGTPSSGPGSFAIYNARLFMSAIHPYNENIWAYDSETGEANLVVDFDENEFPSFVSGLISYSDRLFFSAEGDERGRELWVYDSATNEATLVRDINPDGDASPSRFCVYDDLFFFTANGGDEGSFWFTMLPQMRFSPWRRSLPTFQSTHPTLTPQFSRNGYFIQGVGTIFDQNSG